MQRSDPSSDDEQGNHPLSPSSSDSELSSASEHSEDQRSGLSSAFGGAKARIRKRRRAQSHPSSAQPVKRHATDPGEWERHTRGIGSKILAKHGFTGRLGKRADGIAAPLQPVFRPEKLGLGAGVSREKVDAVEVEEAIETLDKETGYSKRRRGKQHDVMPDNAFEKIIDTEELPHPVHGVETFLQADQKGKGAEKTEIAARLFSAPEVVYNLRMLASNARTEVAKAKRRRDTENLIARTAEMEVNRGVLEKEEATQALSYISEVEHLFDRFAGTRKTANPKLFVTYLKQLVNVLKTTTQKSLVSTQLVVAAITEVVSEYVEEQMNNCLLETVEQGKADKKQVRYMYDILSEVQNAVDPAAYTKLCTRAILVPLRGHISRPGWDVVRGASVGDMLSWMRRILPEAILTIFAEEVLVPRLLSRLQAHHSSSLIHIRTEVPAHVWIHPWLPATGRRSLVEVIHRVRVALSKSLQEWGPGGSKERCTELVELVKSWSKVLSRRKLQLALSRHITPKLGNRLICVAQRNSDEHDAKSTLDEITAWADVGSVRLFARDLTGAFLGGPGALIQKAALSDGSWTTAKDIYVFWTQSLPKRLKEYMQPVLAALLFVLHAARVTTDQGTRRRLERADLNPLLKNMFERPLLADGQGETMKRKDTGTARETRKARLVDVLEMVGEREGLAVLGLGQEHGMRVFRIGAARVVVDVERNVFVVRGQVVDVDEIVRLAKKGWEV